MSLKINRVNYSLQMKVHLYCNKDSFNRDSDSTPRFYLKPVKLLHIEKIAFTKHARGRGYTEVGHRNWKHKHPGDNLTTEAVEKIYKDVQENYPYGHKPDDPATKLKYELDVKQNDAFQAYYSRYWSTHTDKQVSINKDSVYPHPYIEFTVNEVVTIKYPVGTVPSLPEGLSPWAVYDVDKTYYSDPDHLSCYKEDINVYVRVDDRIRFHIEDFASYGLSLGSSGQSYNFHLKSGASGAWPTGENLTYFSGYKLAFSTGSNGEWEGFNDAEDDGTDITVKRYASPSDSITAWYFTVGNKTNSHSYYGDGSSLGFLTSGLGDASAAQSADLSLVRGNTYVFNQLDSSNLNHPLYISTQSGDEAIYTGIFSSGVTRPAAASDGIGSVQFTVPYDAPDELYYNCENHQYMGGKLSISDPVAVSGNQPGHTIRVTFNQNIDGEMFYYCASGDGGPNEGLSGMGGYIFLRKECPGAPIDLTNIYGY